MIPKHLWSDIDHLIPAEIIAAAQFDRFDLQIVLQGSKANNVYPSVNIWIDQTCVWSGQVIGCCDISYTTEFDIDKPTVQIKIEMVDKDAVLGTKVDTLGNIIEDQSVTIEQIIINDIDIVANGTVYQFGHYHLNLTADQTQYFTDHGISVAPSHTLTMHSNGQWRLTLGLPATRFIAKTVSPQRGDMKWPDNELMIKMLETCNKINQLQKIKHIKGKT